MLRDKLMKHLQKKGKKLDPMEQEAKMGVIKSLSEQAGGMMGDKVKGLKKVSIMSDSEHGLEKGLDKAKQMVHSKLDEDHPDGLGDKAEEAEEELGEDLDKDHEEGESPEHQAKVFGKEGSPEEEASESPAEAEAEGDDMSHEEIDARMRHLMHKKSQLPPKHSKY